MSRRTKDIAAAVLQELAAGGATLDHVGQTKGGHQVVRWSLNGQRLTSIFASTASDHRTHMNTTAMIRRQMRSTKP